MRKISFLLVVVLLLGVFAGCGQQAQTGDTKKISLYLPLTPMEDDEKVFAKANEIVKEELGVEIDFYCVDIGSYQEKMRMNMSAGKEFDICWTGYINTSYDAAKKGGIIELDDLIDEHAPELKKAIPEFVFEDAKFNGKLYCVPNYQIMALPAAVFIRKDLYEKYNVAEMDIKNTRELEPFLKKVLDNEKDVFPFRTAWHIDSFRGPLDNDPYDAYVASAYVSTKTISDTKRTVAPIYESDDFNQNVKTMREWYNKGYIRKDIASVMDDTTDYKTGKYAVTVQGYKPGIEADILAETGYDYVPIVLENAKRGVGTATQTAFSIGANSKDPVTAIKVIELLNTNKELYNTLVFGIEGEHYTKLDDGRIHITENAKYSRSSDFWILGNTMNALIEDTKPVDYLEQCDKINKESEINVLSKFKFDNTPVKTEIANCSSVYEEYKLIRYGAVDLEDYMPKFKKDLDNAGVDKIVAEYEKQLNEFLKNNK